MADVSYRLTFNKPAGRQYLEGHTGVVITFDRKGVYFRPVRKARGDNCVTLVPRGERGGYEAIIDGTEAKALLRAMLRDATPSHPFFLLVKNPDDPQTLSLEHYQKDDAPPKIEPHVRLWPPQPKAKERRAAADPNVAAEKKREGVFGAFDDLRRAHAVIMDHAENRRIGRPTRELESAKAIMAEFDRVVREIRPSPLDGIELTPDQRNLVAEVMRNMASVMGGGASTANPVPASAPVAMMLSTPEAPRRRGRPPKNAALREAPQEAPRRRGRPPKNPAKNVAPQEAPRRRGRPRKDATSAEMDVPRTRKAAPAGRTRSSRTGRGRNAAPEGVAESLPPAPLLDAAGVISSPPPSGGDEERRVVPVEEDDLTPDQRDLILNVKALEGMNKAQRA